MISDKLPRLSSDISKKQSNDMGLETVFIFLYKLIHSVSLTSSTSSNTIKQFRFSTFNVLSQ